MIGGPRWRDGYRERRRDRNYAKIEKQYRELAVMHAEAARRHLRNAEPHAAKGKLALASRYSTVGRDFGLRADVLCIGSRANAMIGQLKDATQCAELAVMLYAEHPILAGSRGHREAEVQLGETWEMRGWCRKAAEHFEIVANELDPVSETDLLVNTLNHYLSLGAKLGDADLAERGVKRGRPLLDMVSEPDEVAAFCQWEAIWWMRYGDPVKARALWEEGLTYRARTVTRERTKLFGAAHLLVVEGLVAEGAEMLQKAILGAEGQGMYRYVAAGLRLQTQLGLA